MSTDPSSIDDDLMAKLDDATSTPKNTTPAWARRFPKRTIVLAIIAAVALLLFWVFQSTATTANPNTDVHAFLAPWRYALASTVLLWVAIVTGASALWTWLLHVRDREYIVRELAYRAQAARRR